MVGSVGNSQSVNGSGFDNQDIGFGNDANEYNRYNGGGYSNIPSQYNPAMPPPKLSTDVNARKERAVNEAKKFWNGLTKKNGGASASAEPKKMRAGDAGAEVNNVISPLGSNISNPDLNVPKQNNSETLAAASTALADGYSKPTAMSVARDLNEAADKYDKHADSFLLDNKQKNELRQHANNMREVASELNAGRYQPNEINELGKTATEINDNITKLAQTKMQNKAANMVNLLDHFNVIMNMWNKMSSAQLARADNILDRLTNIR